jgi:hypothetical protein
MRELMNRVLADSFPITGIIGNHFIFFLLAERGKLYKQQAGEKYFIHWHKGKGRNARFYII